MNYTQTNILTISPMVGRKGVEDHKKTLRGRVKIELDIQLLNTLS
jgi:hypothetical protein